jgi:hypothetical protein
MTMKRIAYNIAAGLLCCTLATALTACQGDELSSQSVMTDDGLQYHDPFDDWLYMNYTVPYNIRLKYHMEDIESEYEYTLAPADYDKAVRWPTSLNIRGSRPTTKSAVSTSPGATCPR